MSDYLHDECFALIGARDAVRSTCAEQDLGILGSKERASLTNKGINYIHSLLFRLDHSEYPFLAVFETVKFLNPNKLPILIRCVIAILTTKHRTLT